MRNASIECKLKGSTSVSSSEQGAMVRSPNKASSARVRAGKGTMQGSGARAWRVPHHILSPGGKHRLRRKASRVRFKDVADAGRYIKSHAKTAASFGGLY
jgi:hypothetical protein